MNTDGVTAYKGFDINFKCRDMQYEVGKTFSVDGDVVVCEHGLHACERPLDVLAYYQPGTSRFAEVHMHGEIRRGVGDTDSKLAAASLTVVSEISFQELVARTIEWTAASGVRLHSSTGDRRVSRSRGDRSVASSVGYYSVASSTGYSSVSSSVGYYSVASSTGYSSMSSSTGDYSVSSSTGSGSVAWSTGASSVSISTGVGGVSSSAGDYSVSCSAGTLGAAEALGSNSVALSAGRSGRARASEGSAIVCCYRHTTGELVHIRLGIAGRDGIKPNVWYELNEYGAFVESI
jgi:hypothetical protein